MYMYINFIQSMDKTCVLYMYMYVHVCMYVLWWAVVVAHTGEVVLLITDVHCDQQI